jgi:hypothetical protein
MKIERVSTKDEYQYLLLKFNKESVFRSKCEKCDKVILFDSKQACTAHWVKCDCGNEFMVEFRCNFVGLKEILYSKGEIIWTQDIECLRTS